MYPTGPRKDPLWSHEGSPPGPKGSAPWSQRAKTATWQLGATRASSGLSLAYRLNTFWTSKSNLNLGECGERDSCSQNIMLSTDAPNSNDSSVRPPTVSDSLSTSGQRGPNRAQEPLFWGLAPRHPFGWSLASMDPDPAWTWDGSIPGPRFIQLEPRRIPFGPMKDTPWSQRVRPMVPKSQNGDLPAGSNKSLIWLIACLPLKHVLGIQVKPESGRVW